nr:glycosyl hydrolase family 65 protein [Kineosphaera limosa]
MSEARKAARDGSAYDPIDRHRFPADPWRLVERWPSLNDLGVTETLFAVGNGYLGMRGNPPEGRDAHVHGTFVNGFHETWPIRHAEAAFGFAKTGQTIVNVPDSKLMKLYVDDEPLLLSTADLENYERCLDFRDGTLRRDLVWRTPSGKKVQVRTSRMVSFTERHLAIMTIEVTMLEGDAPIVISSQVLNRQDGVDEYHVKGESMGEGFDPRKASAFAQRVLEPRGHWNSDRRMIMGYRCADSGMTLAVGTDHAIMTENDYEDLISTEPDLGKRVFRIDATQGRSIFITKAVAYHTSRGVPVRELFDRCRRTLDRVRHDGVQHYQEEQARWLANYWEHSDVEVDGHDAIQQAVRYNLFQLAQASARSDQLGVPAKGVTGSGYEGHYFWDTEIYVVPFLAYTSPAVARNLLRFRVNMLEAARTRAAEMAQRGALFPWRTINGEEASAYYAAGTAQYHIDADIAYAIYRYVQATGDLSFMRRYGAEVLVETARLWADLGFWHINDERTFNIHGVTGPDEYTTVVNNNLFTNVMARFNLELAARTLRWLRDEEPYAYSELASRLKLDPAEIDDWQDCADRMKIPFEQGLGIHPQDEHFLDREMWDLTQTPDSQRPLLLHYHPLVIYRFQVLKQADVVLALFLQGDRFTAEEKRANFEYYDAITTGDSSLSAVVQSIIASEVGHHAVALAYFLQGLYVDLADLHRNTSDGLHIASAGGVWNALVYGFGGLRDSTDTLTFDPRLPADWPRLAFRLQHQGSRLHVEVTQEEITFTLVDGPATRVSVRGDELELTGDEPLVVALDGQGPRLKDRISLRPMEGAMREDGSVITAGIPTITDDMLEHR